jgi:hypothetical protein
MSTKTPTNKKPTGREMGQYSLPFKGKFERLLEEKVHQSLREEMISLFGEGESSQIIHTPDRQIILPTDEEIKALERPEFDRYREIFGSSFDRHSRKWQAQGTWYTVGGPPPRHLLDSFLKTGNPAIGVLGRWYPKYMIIDIDERPLSEVEEIRASMGLNENNSILCPSESKNSYHIIVPIQYRGKPPTLNLLRNITQRCSLFYGIEIFPQEKRTIRLPFGPYQGILDPGREDLVKWYEKFNEFVKAHPYDLSRVPRQQVPLDLSVSRGGVELGHPETAQELLMDGLQRSSSRNESQYKILDYYWRNNEPPEVAVRRVKWWIRHKHNGRSKTVNKGAWKEIDQDIERQASLIYSKRAMMDFYPDAVHNDNSGYISKPDLIEIAKFTKGNLPRMRYAFHIIKYVYPRRHRPYVNVHTDRLIGWSSKDTYLQYLNELEERGIVERTKSYLAGQFAKSVKFPGWKFQSDKKAVLYSGRSVETFEDTVKLGFEPWEFRNLLKSVGVTVDTSLKMTNRIFGEGTGRVLSVGDIKAKVTK